MGLVAHGSAVKGDFVPNCSDVDLHLYLEDAALIEGKLPLSTVTAIQRDLSGIDPAPFRYVQGHALPVSDDHLAGLVPGAYAVVAGSAPVREATGEELRKEAWAALTGLDTYPDFLANGLLESGGARLSSNVRLLCTKVWPVLSHLLIVRGVDPLAAWNLPKSQAIDLLPETEPAGRAIREFRAAVDGYYPEEGSAEGALAVIDKGVLFLHAARIVDASR